MKSAHFIRYRAEGFNRNNLLNTLQKNGVGIIDVVAKSAKITEFSIDSADRRKFFAITENLCYNITRIREHGVLFPLVRLSRKVGVLIGIIVFVAFAAVSDRVVLAVDYSGSGAIYKEEAAAALDKLGIGRLRFVDAADLRAAENEILRSTDRFSFASLKKSGSRLQVELALSPTASGVIDRTRTSLVTPVGGIIESIRVYRGTALVAVGDKVNAGDTLIGGFNEIKGNRVETYVLGTVTVRAEYNCVYEGDESGALPFARESLADAEIIEENIEAVGENKFAVRLAYRIKVK